MVSERVWAMAVWAWAEVAQVGRLCSPAPALAPEQAAAGSGDGGVFQVPPAMRRRPGSIAGGVGSAETSAGGSTSACGSLIGSKTTSIAVSGGGDGSCRPTKNAIANIAIP